MSNFLIYILEINVGLVFLFCLFQISKKKFSYPAQRIILIAIPILVLLIEPLKKMWSSKTQALYHIEIINIPTIQNMEGTSNFFSIELIYWLGFIIMLGVSLVKIWWIQRFFRSKDHWNNNGVEIYESDQNVNFSFLNKVHLQRNLASNEKQIILEHELLHIKSKHSVDLLLLEIAHAFYWYNPLFYLLKKNMVQIHEFEVDAKMYQNHKSSYLQHLLNQTFNISGKQNTLTSHFSNKLSLSKRINNMKTNSKKNHFILLTIPALIIGLSLVSWTNTGPSLNVSKSAILENEKPSKMPEFKGGQKALVEYLLNSIEYPKSAKKKGIEGKVQVSFVVKKNGAIKDAKVIKSVNPQLDKEALRVIKSMPNWNPGQKDNKNVDVQLVLPIVFKL